MTFATENLALSNTRIEHVEITLDFCSLTYGTGDCTASGSAGQECFNTWQTCQDRANFDKTTKTYKFSSVNAPQSEDAARPYLLSIRYQPTEIKSVGDNDSPKLTVTGIATLVLLDENDDDIGIDPYLANRDSVQGSYFKKLIARNPNFKGRPVQIKEGFPALTVANYQDRKTGIIDNIKIGKNQVTIAVVDDLDALDDIQIPEALDISVAAPITAAATQATLSGDYTSLPATGYVRINDEIIYYGAKSDSTGIISSLSRGQFDTEALAHDIDDGVTYCYYFAPANPYTHLKTIAVTLGGIPSARWDQDTWDYWQDWPEEDIDFSALIIDQTDASTLFWEIVNLLNIHVWQDENQVITCRRNFVNEPDITPPTINDAGNIINDSCTVDLNTASRINQVILFWDKDGLGDADDPKSFNEQTIGVDADAQSENDMNAVASETVYCRWIRRGYETDERLDQYVKMLVLRRVMAKSTAAHILGFNLSRKDSSILTGDVIEITTDELQDKNGNSEVAQYMISRREPVGNLIKCKAFRIPQDKVAFISDTDDPDGVAEAQTPTGSGNLTLTGSPVTMSGTNRRGSMYCAEDASSVTFTWTYKETAGGSNQTSDACTGPDGEEIEITKSGVPISFHSVSQIAVSGACPEIIAGYFLDYDDATEAEKRYGFISNADGYMDSLNTDPGYLIW